MENSQNGAAATALPEWMVAWRGILFAQRSLLVELEKAQKRDFGLSIAQFEALMTLLEAPGHRLRMSELSARLLYSSGSATKLFDRLVERGLAAREPDGRDSRVVTAVLTEAGAELITAARAAHAQFLHSGFAERIAPDELEVLARVARRLAADRGVSAAPSIAYTGE